MVPESEYFRVDTYDPLRSVPRIIEFYHAAAGKGYFSSGNIRAGESHCIFHYTLRGSGETWSGGKRYRTAPGIGFLNIINDPDSGYCYPADEESEWEFIVICFDFGNARSMTQEMIKTFGPLYMVPKEQMIPLTERIRTFQNNIASKHDSIRLFAALMAALMQHAEHYASAEMPDPIRRAKAYIEANIQKSVTVTEISKKLNYSREHLSRLFIKYTGQSLKAYLIRERYNRICRLLKQTDKTVAEIAADMNFDSASNLTLFFRKCRGMTPVRYRKYGSYPP